MIWSDESSFEIGKNLRQFRLWQLRPYKRYAWDCIAPTFRSGRTLVMVWGAFTNFDKCPLVIMPLDNRTTSNFVTIAFEAILSRFKLLHDHPQQLKLMEGGALVHCSSFLFKGRQAHGMAQLIWHANSPNLNPIENLWKIVKDLLRHRPRPKIKEEMEKKPIQSTWYTTSLEQLQTLIRTMHDRMQAVILARGGSTRW